MVELTGIADEVAYSVVDKNNGVAGSLGQCRDCAAVRYGSKEEG